jgi:metallo-beta-lactamase family protein
VKIHGQIVGVNARIERLDSMSAHADAAETLRWLRGFTRAPKATYLIHGESAPMQALKSAIESEFKWMVRMPNHLEAVELN